MFLETAALRGEVSYIKYSEGCGEGGVKNSKTRRMAGGEGDGTRSRIV